MEKIIEALIHLTTVREDIQKHIVGAMISMWPIMVIRIFFGLTAGLIAGGTVVMLFILWEIYHMVKHKKPFSMLDVLAGTMTIAPFLIMMAGGF